MNRESFLETVKQQYSEEIHEAYLEHAHGGGKDVDMPGLKKKLQKLMASAKVEGLSPAEFEELARTTLPTEIAQKIDLSSRKAA